MATDYASNPVFGSAWANAKARGDTALMNTYQQHIDSMTPADVAQNAQQVGMINAKTADMGRGTNVFANSNDGMEYNTVGQYRTPGQGSFNTMSGQHGYAVNPGAVQGAPVGGAMDPTQTMTAAQYGAANPAPYVPYGGTTPIYTHPQSTYNGGAGGNRNTINFDTNPVGNVNPGGGAPAGGGLLSGGNGPASGYTPWVAPTTKGRSANFDLANSMWSNNAQNYRNYLAAMLKK